MSGLTARGAPTQPAWVLYIRYTILGLSLLCLALGAWSVAIFGGTYYIGYSGGAGGLVIFVTILTFIVYGGGVAIEMYAPQQFFRIGFLIGYIFLVIFWLSAWAWSASMASFWLAFTYGFGLEASPSNPGIPLAVCAAIGAIVWILTIVNLVMFIKACIADPNGGGQVEFGNIKHQPAAYPAAPAAYPQQAYPVQPQAYPQQAYPAQQPYPGQQQPYAAQ